MASPPYGSKIKFSLLEWDDAKSQLRLVLGPRRKVIEPKVFFLMIQILLKTMVAKDY